MGLDESDANIILQGLEALGVKNEISADKLFEMRSEIKEKEKILADIDEAFKKFEEALNVCRDSKK